MYKNVYFPHSFQILKKKKVIDFLINEFEFFFTQKFDQPSKHQLKFCKNVNI